MPELKNTDNLPGEVRDVFLPFLKKMIQAAEGEIVSALIYGSATGKNFISKVSDINSVVVVRAITPEVMAKGLKIMTAVHNRRIRAPLFLTEDHIRSSLDVFPIEFWEMKDNYVVLFGKDPLKDIVVEAHHARLFCEQQVKGKLIRIRQGYLEIGNKKSAIEALLKESLNTLIPVFRMILRLVNVEPPSDKGRVLDAMGEALGINTTAMMLIWKDKKNDEQISGRDVHEVFGRYIKELEALAGKVDQL